jgi:hypothetical protein
MPPFPAMVTAFSVLLSDHADSVWHTHPSIPWEKAVLSPEVKRPEHEMTTHLRLMISLKVILSMPLFPNMPLRTARGQFYCNFTSIGLRFTLLTVV